MIYIKKITKDLIDKNNHLNISNYIKLIDNSNARLIKSVKKRDYHFVAKKIIMENSREIKEGEICKIKSFLIKVTKFFIISRHEIFVEKNNMLRAKCYMQQVPISSKSKKIIKIKLKDQLHLNKLKKKNYIDPFL